MSIEPFESDALKGASAESAREQEPFLAAVMAGAVRRTFEMDSIEGAERAVIAAARSVVKQPRTWRVLKERLADLDRLRAAKASQPPT